MGFLLDLGAPVQKVGSLSCTRHRSIAGAVPIDGLWASAASTVNTHTHSHTHTLVSPWACPQAWS